MEQPFTVREARELRDVVDLIYEGAEFPDDDDCDDARLVDAWSPWVHECTMWMLDADGAYAHFMHPGVLPEQPAYDMHVYDVIRRRWVQRKNEEITSGK